MRCTGCGSSRSNDSEFFEPFTAGTLASMPATACAKRLLLLVRLPMSTIACGYTFTYLRHEDKLAILQICKIDQGPRAGIRELNSVRVCAQRARVRTRCRS